MSEREEYTPRAETLQEAYEYWVAGLGGSDGHEVERFLEAHDRALREEIARLIAPTEAEIQAAAESLHPGLFTLSDFHYGIEFDNLPKDRPYHQEKARDEARAALVAARKVAVR